MSVPERARTQASDWRRIFGSSAAKALIEDHEVRPLEQRPGDVQPTAFPVAQLPPALIRTHHTRTRPVNFAGIS
jgi:hypothetical protein